ncbi:MAG: fumarate hydratase [Candidatus Goldiibacteriota bacterium]|jgi:fumarate hydratase subunit alpha
MRIISPELVTSRTAELVSDCNYFLPHDVVNALKEAAENEEDKKAKTMLYKIIENHKTAKKGVYPLCQDTGISVIFLEVGNEVQVDGDIYRAINRGVEQGYEKGFLRKSVANPLTRINTGTNTPAIIHTSLIKGPNIKISAMTKGAGSENKGALKMLSPADGEAAIMEFVIDTVKKAGASACPPYIVGVGIGGDMETCALLAKKSLLRSVNDFNGGDKNALKLEKELLRGINSLGIGPLGFGGRTTALAVKVETFPCHIASLPVAVCIQCHSARHKTITI